MWLTLAILSSFCLGFYDILKKASLNKNAFIPVLFSATSVSAVLFCIVIAISRIGILDLESMFFVPQITPREHALFFLKSVIVGTSWFLAYMALSHIPLTIVAPIRATGPFWVLIGAVWIFNEAFSLLQWVGIITVLLFFYFFSLVGKKEGIHFLRNKWIYAIIAATLVGAISGLYDKYLLMRCNPMAVQAWFSIYMVVVLFPFLMILWFPKRDQTPVFQWRLTIPAIGLVLSIADYLYFYALSDPNALIGIISMVRRGSVIIAFSLGGIIFKEKNIKRKSIALFGILAGIILLIIGT